MPKFPSRFDGQRFSNAGMGTSKGTTITASGSTNTKGSYTQLIASTPFNADQVLVFLAQNSNACGYLIDIAVGGAGSEQVILSNLHIEHATTGGAYRGDIRPFPIQVPAGSRLSARCQAQNASVTCFVSVLLISSGMRGLPPLGRVATYGADTSDSGGTSIDPGGSANTKGAWTEIAAAVGMDVLGILLKPGNQINNVRTTCFWKMDIGVGAGGSEQIIIPDLQLGAAVSDDQVLPMQFPFLPVNIPSGSRIAARASCDITDATDRLFDLIIYGVG